MCVDTYIYIYTHIRIYMHIIHMYVYIYICIHTGIPGSNGHQHTEAAGKALTNLDPELLHKARKLFQPARDPHAWSGQRKPSLLAAFINGNPLYKLGVLIRRALRNIWGLY